MGGKSNTASLIGLNSAKHVVTNKHHDGVEAPRNSLDLPLETASRQHTISESLSVKQPSSKMNFQHHIGAPVKMLNNDEDSNTDSIKRGGPGVVARLMGMDPLPPGKGPTSYGKESLDENPRKQVSRVPRFVSTKIDLSTLSSTASNRLKEESAMNCNKQYSGPSTMSPITGKPHRREHPQEELLQKFKKEFESWQASKLWECSSNLDQNDSSQGLKNEQSGAMEDLNMDKIARSSKRCIVQTNPIEAGAHTSGNKVKMAPPQLDGFHHEGNLDKQCVARTKDETNTRRTVAADSFGPLSKGKVQSKRSRSGSPTRIVILKPSSEINEVEESRGGSSEALERSSNIEDFLEEVKERLRLEIEGKGKNVSIRGNNVARSFLHERPTDPKQLAHDITKHIKEYANREVGATSSVMSESTRSYRNDFHLYEHETSDSIKRDTRKFISDRLKNALKDDTKLEKPIFNDGRAGNSLVIKEKERLKSMSEYCSKEGKGASFWEEKKAVNESIPKYLRREHSKVTACDADTMSPPNFIRPISASASGKLILEDQQVVAVAQICQKEDSETYSAAINRNKKDGFNFKGTVSNLRRNLSFKGKIFGKKMSSNEESTSETNSHVKPIETIPTVIRNIRLAQDNYTEVPPSPASFSNSPTTENHSPVSPLEAPFVADNSSSQASGELSLTLLDSGNRAEQVGRKGSEEVETEAQQLYGSNESPRNEGHAESYIRDILVFSGLYKASPLDEALSRLDIQTESISSCIFDEVEDKLFKSGNVDGDCCKLGDINVDRKLLFDLVNEALPGVLRAPMTPWISKRWTRGPPQFQHGRKLLNELLGMIQIYANSNVDQLQSEDKVLVWDVKLMPWLTASQEDISYIEKEVEGLITTELIDELVSDLLV